MRVLTSLLHIRGIFRVTAWQVQTGTKPLAIAVSRLSLDADAHSPGDGFIMLCNNLCKCALILIESGFGEYSRSLDGSTSQRDALRNPTSLVTDGPPIKKLCFGLPSSAAVQRTGPMTKFRHEQFLTHVRVRIRQVPFLFRPSVIFTCKSIIIYIYVCQLCPRLMQIAMPDAPEY